MPVSNHRLLLVSADDHAGPPLPAYRDYFEPGERDEFDRYWRARPRAKEAEAAAAGDLDALAGSLVAFMRATGASEEAATSFARRAHRSTAGLFDSAVRDACLDEDGIAAEVIYPDGFVENHPPYRDPADAERLWSGGPRRSFERMLAGSRAYNRWLAEFCARSPARRAGVILVPPAHDVSAVVAEMTRARLDGLVGGVLVPPLAPGLPGHHDRHYDPIWSAAADLGLPIAIHGGTATAPDAKDVFGGAEPLASILHFTECAFFDRRPLWHFIWGGVFDRHPRLRLVFAEALAHWVPQELLRLDEMYDMWNLKVLRDRLPLRPSEYWRRHCAITATFPSRAEIEMRAQIGLGNMLWGSDYPHPEGTWPHTETCLRHAFHAIDAADASAILGANAIALYGLDRAALREVADRIGPDPATVARAPGRRPDDYVGMGLR